MVARPGADAASSKSVRNSRWEHLWKSFGDRCDQAHHYSTHGGDAQVARGAATDDDDGG